MNKQKAALLIFFSILGCVSIIKGQVSLPERNPFKLSLRAGGIANNPDMEAELKGKTENSSNYTVNIGFSPIGEIELAADLLRFRGACLGMQISGMYAQPEFFSEGSDGKHKVGLTQLEIARANITIAFNGSDPYTMFELPYHSNKEVALGICGMIVRTENTSLTSYAKDTLKIKKISGEYCHSLGFTFGWNWRIGESSWVVGLNGAIMFLINKNPLVNIETDELSTYTSGSIDFAPRVFTAGIGYHF